MVEIKIILIEDNMGDILLINEAINQSCYNCSVTSLTDGEKGIQYLDKLQQGAYMEPPGLILLDINLPKISGKEILYFIKSNPQLKTIPVAIFSSSAYDKDINDAKSLNADYYFQKPADLTHYFQVIESILQTLTSKNNKV